MDELYGMWNYISIKRGGGLGLLEDTTDSISETEKTQGKSRICCPRRQGDAQRLAEVRETRIGRDLSGQIWNKGSINRNNANNGY